MPLPIQALYVNGQRQTPAGDKGSLLPSTEQCVAQATEQSATQAGNLQHRQAMGGADRQQCHAGPLISVRVNPLAH